MSSQGQEGLSRSIYSSIYIPKLDFLETQEAIKLIKDTFQKKLSESLKLKRVTAPRFLMTGTGLQDDLAGTQTPVSFKTKFLDQDIEVVHSLAKWKRQTLGKYGFKPGTGLYTDMDAIRKDEDVDETHSIYVDQWDWELVIREKDRKIKFLKETVERIYRTIVDTEEELHKRFPILERRLLSKIHFVYSQDLEDMYPDMTPKQREDEITRKYGAVFIIGIGYPLKSGTPHDARAADYDDWITDTGLGRGLDGDILIWDHTRQKSLEVSSMGIRVDRESLIAQLKFTGLEDRMRLDFHKGIIEGTIPLTIGGGIGQSRLCMLLLHKVHIGEVQSSVWPEEHRKEMRLKGIELL
ncbi:MAG: aspartate--ammonia ligase [Candidatus Woesearchaeota archaeon]